MKCPECEQGKVVNCTLIVPDTETGEFVPCETAVPEQDVTP